MTLWYGYSSDAEKRAGLVLNIWVLQEDSAGNRSKVAWVVDFFDNSPNNGGNGTTNWYATAAGNNYSGSVTYDFTGNSYSQIRLLDNSAGTWLAHNTNGTQSVSVAASTDANSPVGSTSVSGTLTLTDYARPPAAPAAPSLSRSSDGGTITITSAVATSVMTVTDYQYIWSTDDANWQGPNAMGTSRVATFTGSPTQPYYFATRAFSSEGWGAWSASTGIAGVPSAPSSVSTTRSGRDVTVTSAAAADNGATVTAAYVQLSTDGVNWSNTQTLSGWSYTYTGLNLGTQYFFRVWATNAIGTGSATASSGISIPNVPAAPTSVTAVRTARSVTVTCGTADGQGATVTGYLVQYSTNGGSSWSSAQPMSSQSYTYSNLTAALTYTFRVYATNEMGNGATTSSTPLFVPAGGKRWDGSAWTSTTTAKRWDGTNWVDLSTAKRWDGTNWVDLS